MPDLPDIIEVPVFELFPLSHQKHVPYRFIKGVAEFLDIGRMFFRYLWYPWDTSRDSNIKDWANEHLDARLTMYVYFFSFLYLPACKSAKNLLLVY